MRLFVALEIPQAVRENLSALIHDLRPMAPQARWVRAENLHVTLKFLGEAAPAKLDAIRKTLSGVPGEGPISLNYRGLGFFPDERRPRVFWAGIAAGPELVRLAGEIESRLEAAAFPRERRTFSAHLTLARFSEPGSTEKLRSAVRECGTLGFGEHLAREFCLFQSELRPAGAQYSKLASFPIAAEA